MELRVKLNDDKQFEVTLIQDGEAATEITSGAVAINMIARQIMLHDPQADVKNIEQMHVACSAITEDTDTQMQGVDLICSANDSPAERGLTSSSVLISLLQDIKDIDPIFHIAYGIMCDVRLRQLKERGEKTV